MKLKHLLLGLGAIAALFSCKQEEPYVEPALEVSIATVSFGSASEEKVVYITSNNDWTAESDQDWLTLSATSGKASTEKAELVLSAEENTAESARVAKVTVKAAGLTKEISITQAAVDAKPEEPAEVTVSVTTLEATATAGEYTFQLTSNKAWTVTDDAEWVNVDPATGEPTTEAVTVKVTVAANSVQEPRTATIKVAAQDLEKTVVLTQAAAEANENGTQEKPWLIKTTDDLAAMRSKALPGTETWFRLENDIDMAAVTNWVPVNYGDVEGEGEAAVTTFNRKIHFDGNNKTISNFAPATWNDGEAACNYPSLFGVLYGSCKDLTITAAKIEVEQGSTGILAGYVGTTDKPATVSNVSVQGVVNVTGSGTKVGGVCGAAYDATFTGCKTDVTMTVAHQDVAGFVGRVYGACSFTNCEAKAVIKSTIAEKARTAVFAGYLSGTDATLEECKVLTGSEVTIENGKTASYLAMCGGLVAYDGSTNKTTIKNCPVDAQISAVWGSNVAGVVAIKGAGGNLEVTGSNVTGALSADKQVAGIVGLIEKAGEVVINGCNNTASITGGTTTNSHYNAGVLSWAQTANTVALSNCSSTADISSPGSSNGGLVGATNTNVTTFTMDNCYCTGSVAGNNNIGGLVGNLQSGGHIKNSYYKGAKINSVGSTVGGIVGGSYTNLVQNCYVETDIAIGASNSGGVVGQVHANCTSLKVDKCYFKGTIVNSTANSNCIGGVVGRINIESGMPEVTRCWSEGSIIVKAKNIGGVVGYASPVSVANCWSSMNIVSDNQAIGGIVGSPAKNNESIVNCYFAGTVEGKCGVGGIVGLFENCPSVTVENCVSFATKVIAQRTDPTNYSSGAVIGNIRTDKTSPTTSIKNNWRKADMEFKDYVGLFPDVSAGPVEYNNPLVDHENVAGAGALPPFLVPQGQGHKNDWAQLAYHGKAAAADATVSSVAQTLGWDAAIWDFSGALPTLK